MRKLLVSAAVFTACTSLTAQADHFTTSPEGLDYLEGNSKSDDILGSSAMLRFQQIDATNTRSMGNRNRVGFRRDGNTLPGSFGARNVDLELVLAEGDISAFGTDFDANYASGSNAVVMTRKVINFEDWSAPQGLAAPETNVIFLDQLHSYAGTTAGGTDLIWEVRVWANDQAGSDYPYDLEYVVRNATFGPVLPTSAAANRVTLSTGCPVPVIGSNFGLGPEIENYGDRFELSASIFRAPPSVPATLVIDNVDRNLTVPGFCASFHAITGINLSMGNTDATGAAALAPIVIAHTPVLIGIDLFFQAYAPCVGCFPGQADLAISRGMQLTVPQDPPLPQTGRIWSFDPAATTADFGPVTGGIVLWTNHN